MYFSQSFCGDRLNAMPSKGIDLGPKEDIAFL
jgi:hypothetical protein